MKTILASLLIATGIAAAAEPKATTADKPNIVVTHASNQSVPGLNKNILVEDNLCESPGRHAFVIASSDNVVIRRNRIVGCAMPIYVSNSTQVLANDNFGATLTPGSGCQTVPVSQAGKP